jgi:hypothetical protein
MKFLDILTENDSERNFQKAKAIFIALRTGEVKVHLDEELIQSIYGNYPEKPANLIYKYNLGHELKLDTYWDNKILRPDELRTFRNCNVKIFVPLQNLKFERLDNEVYKETAEIKHQIQKAIQAKFIKFKIFLNFTYHDLDNISDKPGSIDGTYRMKTLA